MASCQSTGVQLIKWLDAKILFVYMILPDIVQKVCPLAVYVLISAAKLGILTGSR